MKKILLVIYFSVIFFITVFLHRDSFNSYFFQDDWFNIKISKAESIVDFINFFRPRTDVTYYKPLGMQVPFFIMQKVFGLDPFPYHVLVLITHLFNSVLLFLFLKTLRKDTGICLLLSFLYTTSGIHFTHFYWFSAFSLVVSVTYLLITLIVFIKFIKSHGIFYYLVSITVFFMGLLSNEMYICTPVLLFVCLVYLNKQRKLFYLMPYIIITLLLYISRFAFYPPPISGLYTLSLGRHVFNNLQGYLLWSLNWPDEMKAQLINFYTINPLFQKSFPDFYLAFKNTLLINIFFLIIIPIVYFIKKILYKINNILQIDKCMIYEICFGLVWFLSAIIPVLFFPFHSFSYLLPIPLIGLLLTLTTIIIYLFRNIQNKIIAKILVVFFTLNWLFGSFASIEFNKKVHWAPKRAKISKELVTRVYREKVDIQSSGFTVSIPYSPENMLSLNNQEAFQVIYNNKNLKTVYLKL